MSIIIRPLSYLIVGFRFSDLVSLPNNSDNVVFLTNKLKEEVANQFENKEIEVSEVNPEMIAIVFDLDFVETPDKNDAIIGKKIDMIDIGENSGYTFRSEKDIQMRINETKSKVSTIDEEIIKLAHIRVAMIGNLKFDYEE